MPSHIPIGPAASISKPMSSAPTFVRRGTIYTSSRKKKSSFGPRKALGKDFVDAINATEGTKDEIRRRFLDRYLNTVKSFVNELTTIVDSAPPDTNAVSGGIGGFLMGPMVAGPAAGAANAGDHLVVWDSGSLGNILKSFDWQNQPTTLIVRFAQEELWVYKASYAM